VYGEAAQHDLLAGREQLPAPVDHRAECALAVGCVARAAGEQREPVVEPGQQLVHAERPHAAGGELQRERQAVESPADRRDRGRGVGTEDEARRRRGGPRREQLHGARRAHRGEVAGGRWQLQRRDLVEHLARHAERLPARGEDAQVGCGAQQLSGDRGDGVDDLLAVVEHQEQPRAGERLPDPCDEIDRPLPDTEGGRNGGDHPVLGRALALGAHLPVEPGELDETGAVGVLARHGNRQARLPDPARSGERDEPRRAELLAHLRNGLLAADQLGERGGDRVSRARRRALKRRVLREDRALQCGDLRPGFEAELGDECRPQLGEPGEGLALPAGAVERAHVQSAQPLAQRVTRHELAQLGHERTQLRPTECEQRLGSLLLGGEPLLFEPAGGRDGERLVADVGECGTAPQLQCAGEQGDPVPWLGRLPGLCGEHAEAVDVERAGVEAQQVPRRLADHEIAPARMLQGAPQLRDLGLQRVERVAGLLPAPQVLDEPLDGHRAALVDEEVGQQRADLPLRHPHRLAVVGPHDHRPEHSELHMATVTSRPDRVVGSGRVCVDRVWTVRAAPDARGMAADKAVTVLGLGAMGSALARAFLAAGRPVTVWNRTSGKADELVAGGAVEAATAEEAVRASGLVVACVWDHRSVHETLDPVTNALAGRVVVNLTNGTPGHGRELGAWAQERGFALLDGGIMAVPPMIGGPGAFVLYSGPEDAFTTHRDALEALGESRYVGRTTAWRRSTTSPCSAPCTARAWGSCTHSRWSARPASRPPSSRHCCRAGWPPSAGSTDAPRSSSTPGITPATSSRTSACRPPLTTT
jgi:hypothetical protein